MSRLSKRKINNPNYNQELVVHTDDILRLYDVQNIKSNYRRRSNMTQWGKRRLFFRKQLSNGTSNYCAKPTKFEQQKVDQPDYDVYSFSVNNTPYVKDIQLISRMDPNHKLTKGYHVPDDKQIIRLVEKDAAGELQDYTMKDKGNPAMVDTAEQEHFTDPRLSAETLTQQRLVAQSDTRIQHQQGDESGQPSNKFGLTKDEKENSAALSIFTNWSQLIHNDSIFGQFLSRKSAHFLNDPAGQRQLNTIEISYRQLRDISLQISRNDNEQIRLMTLNTYLKQINKIASQNKHVTNEALKVDKKAIEIISRNLQDKIKKISRPQVDEAEADDAIPIQPDVPGDHDDEEEKQEDSDEEASQRAQLQDLSNSKLRDILRNETVPGDGNLGVLPTNKAALIDLIIVRRRARANRQVLPEDQEAQNQDQSGLVIQENRLR
jgi:hypothetical protein